MIGKMANLQMFAPFHHRNFSLLTLNAIIRSVGNWMQMVALGWLVLEMTDSPLSLGIVWATRASPHLIFGMMAGAVADKVDRRNLLVMAFSILAACALAMGFLISTGRIQLWHILLLTFIMGSISVFAMTARQALVVDIVGLEDTMSALSMSAVAMRIIGIFGGVVAGFVIELFGIDWCFYVMVISYMLGIAVLLFIRGVERKAGSAEQSVWGNFVEGMKIIGKNRIILALMAMAIICEIFGFSHSVLQPVFARDILKVGAVGLGMFSAARSVGGLIAGLTLASLGNYKYKGRLMLGVFLFFGVFLVLFAQSPWYPVSLLLLGMIGAMAAAHDALQHILLQFNVTDEQRGRAMGIWQLSIGFGPLGSLTLGALATLLGAQLAQSIYGIAIVAIFFILVVFVPRLRRV